MIIWNKIFSFQGEVAAIDGEINKSVKQLKVVGAELVTARKMEKNMSTSLELLQQCLPVLRAYIKLQQQMNEKRYDWKKCHPWYVSEFSAL